MKEYYLQGKIKNGMTRTVIFKEIIPKEKYVTIWYIDGMFDSSLIRDLMSAKNHWKYLVEKNVNRIKDIPFSRDVEKEERYL